MKKHYTTHPKNEFIQLSECCNAVMSQPNQIPLLDFLNNKERDYTCTECLNKCKRVVLPAFQYIGEGSYRRKSYVSKKGTIINSNN
jgi:hypothetical protein